MDSDQAKLFIGGISWETTEDLLRDHFSRYGDVISTAVIRDKVSDRPRGFGFVVFSDPAVLDTVVREQRTIAGRLVLDARSSLYPTIGLVNGLNGKLCDAEANGMRLT